MSRKYRDKWDFEGLSNDGEEVFDSSSSQYSNEDIPRENENIILGKLNTSRSSQEREGDITINHSIDYINRKYVESNRNGHRDHKADSSVHDKVPYVLPRREDEEIRSVEYNLETNEIRRLGTETCINEIHDSKSRHVVLLASPTTDVTSYVTSYARKVLRGEVPALKHVQLVLFLRFSESAKNKLDKLRNVFVESQISKGHVNAEAFYKWMIKHQDRLLIITKGWDEMVEAVNETRQVPIQYEGSGSAIQILQKLAKGDLFGKSWLLSVGESPKFQLKGEFQSSKTVMVSDAINPDILAGMWMHVVSNRIFSLKHSDSEMQIILHKLMHGAYTATQDGSGHFKLQETKKEWSITKHINDFTLPIAWKTKYIFKDVALKGIRFKQKQLQYMLCALYVVQLPIGQFYDVIDNDFGGGNLQAIKHYVYGVILDSSLRRLLQLVLPGLEDLNLRISALLGRLARRMRVMDMRLIELLCDCGDGAIGLIQHHIRMFTMKAYVPTENMKHIARVLANCSKIHRLQFTDCDFSNKQLDVWIEACKPRKIPVEVMDFSFNPNVTCTSLGILVTKFTVSELVLHECNVTPDQLYQLANGLRRVSQNLKIVDLRWNVLEDEHISPIIKVMRFLSGVLFLSARFRRWEVDVQLRNELENAVWRKPLNKQNIHIAWSN